MGIGKVDDLRTSILRHQIAMLRMALGPFARLGKPDLRHGIQAYQDLEDDVVVYNDLSGSVITAGDVRMAGKILSSSKQYDPDYQP